MKQSHFEQHLAHAFDLKEATIEDGRIVSGTLNRRADGREFPVIKGIPRLLESFDSNYADNFALQWNSFRATQLDSKLGRPYSANRFWADTQWRPEDLKGKRVLEAGSGAGRFTEVLLEAGAELVSFDFSGAVEANFENNGSRDNLFLFQGDIYQIDCLPDGYFDYVFCFGVLQHTPDPEQALQILSQKVRPGGQLAIDWYLKHRLPNIWSTPKYFWRPITRRMSHQTLYKIVKTYVPIWLPVDTFIRSIPFFGRRLLSVLPIPCWNYVKMGLSNEERLEWAIMDTYDALGARYDYPRTVAEVQQLLDALPNLTDQVVDRGQNGVVGRARGKAA